MHGVRRGSGGGQEGVLSGLTCADGAFLEVVLHEHAVLPGVRRGSGGGQEGVIRGSPVPTEQFS
eukprot:8424442-Pyramimonas_sp.AAC.1